MEKQIVERNTELLTAQFAELRQGRKTAVERATVAKEEVRRQASVLSHQKEAELHNYRALIAQQENGRLKRSASNNNCRNTWQEESASKRSCRNASRDRKVPVLLRGIPPNKPGEHIDWRLLESRDALCPSSDALRLCLQRHEVSTCNYRSRESSLQFVHTLNSITQWYLPPIPEFSGVDQTPGNNSFQQWLEQFEIVAKLEQWPETIK